MMMATTRLRATILSCESFEVMRAARACEVVDVVEGVRERARRSCELILMFEVMAVGGE